MNVGGSFVATYGDTDDDINRYPGVPALVWKVAVIRGGVKGREKLKDIG